MEYHAASKGLKVCHQICLFFASHRVVVRRASCPTTPTFVGTQAASSSERGTRDYESGTNDFDACAAGYAQMAISLGGLAPTLSRHSIAKV